MHNILHSCGTVKGPLRLRCGEGIRPCATGGAGSRKGGGQDVQVTLPMAKAKGLLASGPPASELLARCPRALLGAQAPRYLEASKMTAPVVPAGGLPSGTPRTRDRVCKVHWPEGHPTRGQRPCAYRQYRTGVRAEEEERAIHPHA